jgi:lipid II:glycine glycyltransferase (peptidoglycan interpeptide bridge formation enzyme)
MAVCETADSFLQSSLWGAFKPRFGWSAHAFVIDWDGCGQRPLLALCRRLAPGFSFAYIPWGPELPAGFPESQRQAALHELAHKLKGFLPPHTVFIRCDPPWFTDDAAYDMGGNTVGTLYPGLPFVRSAADIQAPDTVLVDLSLSRDELLAAMKPKWRYNIGLADKRSVTITEAGGQGLEVFYQLLEETATRDHIAIHDITYYRTLCELCNSTDGQRMRVYIASHETDPVAATIVLCRGTQAVYLYGASSNIKRNVMAPYALQWKAMQDAQEQGCMVYDLFGIPPTEDPRHPMAGLYRFKTGFGGTIIHRPGSWDYPCKPALYRLFRTVEALRKEIRDRKKIR